MSLRPIPIAVLASGRGSNFDAIYRAVVEKRLDAEIRVVLTDRPEAPVVDKARSYGVPVTVVPVPKTAGEAGVEDQRRHHGKLILAELIKFQPRFLVLAGYMRILSGDLIQAFRSERGYSRIVNIHPSLLPSFPGVGSYSQAFLWGAKVTGVTVHLVDVGVDQGPICAQEAFSISDCGSVEEVEKRGLEIEHRLYPETLKWILEEKFQVQERRVCVCTD